MDIVNLTIANGLARGGNGGNRGGGGAGMGGGIFVNSGNVTLSNVSFSANSAIGGNGGAGTTAQAAGGGGGMGGNGGSATTGGRAGGGGTGTVGSAGGGGGGALGAAVFVRVTNNASVIFIDCTVDAGTLIAGTGASGIVSSVGGNGSTSGSSMFLLGGTTTFTVNSGTKNISGSIGGWSGSTNIIVKNGAGTLLLSGANTYPGETRIDAGVVQVNGSLASVMVINTSATLSGTGTVSTVTLNSGGTVSPGTSPGTLNASNTVWSGAGNYNWQLYNSSGTAGSGFDLLNITGTLNVSAASGFNINLWTLSSLSPDVSGNALNFDFRATKTWTIAQTTGGIIGFNAANFNIRTNAANGTSGFSNPTFNGTFSLSVVGNNLVLTFTPATLAVTTTAATSVTSSGATLNASINPGGNATTIISSMERRRVTVVFPPRTLPSAERPPRP